MHDIYNLCLSDISQRYPFCFIHDVIITQDGCRLLINLNSCGNASTCSSLLLFADQKLDEYTQSRSGNETGAIETTSKIVRLT
jgi:hypothetical protein